MVKAIVDKLDMEGLRCDIISCELASRVFPNKVLGGHCQNLVHITDKKYGVAGSYIEDATWDSRREGKENGFGFAHCLYPVADVQSMRGKKYIQKFYEKRSSSLIFDEEKMAKSFSGKMKTVKAEKQKVPDVVVQYGNQSPAIPLEKYKAGAEVVVSNNPQKFGGTSQQKALVEELIVSSVERSKTVFGRSATSAFTHSNMARGKNKLSFADLDGRTQEVDSAQIDE